MNLFLLIIGGLCLIYGVILLIFSKRMAWRGGILSILSFAALLPAVFWERMPHRSRIVMITGCLLGLAVFLAESILILQTVAQSKKNVPVEYLIVLGSRSYGKIPCVDLKHRIDGAIAYCAKHPETVVIASGGQGADEEYPEALVIEEILHAEVGPELRILKEDRSRSTKENMRFSRELIGNDNASVGIVTNSYHLRRSLTVARNCGFKKVFPVYASMKKLTLPYYFVRETAALFVYQMKGFLEGEKQHK